MFKIIILLYFKIFEQVLFSLKQMFDIMTQQFMEKLR